MTRRSFLAALASAFAASCGFLLPASDIDDLTGLLRDADALAVAQRLVTDTRGAARLGVDMRQIGKMDGRFLADDATLLALGRALMALDHIDAADQGAIFLGKKLDHFALLALVAAGDDDDLVAFADLAHYRT